METLAREIAILIKNENKKIQVVSHYDADGICAGSIMYKTLQTLNKNFEIEFVKQLEESVLKGLSKKEVSMFIFCDLGSGQLKNIHRYIPDKKIIVVDHHQIEEHNWKNLYLLNPHLIGYDGSHEISGAGVTYVLSQILINDEDLIALALVGAIGDVQKKEEFIGLNKQLLLKAKLLGKIKIKKSLNLFGRRSKALHKLIQNSDEIHLPGLSGNESGVVQFLSSLNIPLQKDGKWRTLSDLNHEEEKKLITALMIEDSNHKEMLGDVILLPNKYEIGEFATLLNACGRLGKAEIGLELCLGLREDIEEINVEYRRRIASYLEQIKKNKEFIKKKNATYIIARDSIDEAFIGTITSIFLRSNDDSIVIGFANSDNGVKISARAKKELKNKINLGRILKEVTSKFGGEGGGHALAAGGKIPKNSEERFIESIDHLLKI